MSESRTLLLGLIGDGIGPSRTPAMHEAEGLAQGMPTVYRRIDTAQQPASEQPLAALLQAAVLAGFDGLNITHPHKQAILPLLDEIDPQAAHIGAVNTVVIRDGRTTGYNTDVSGFGRGLREGLPNAALGTVVQLGAGGAGNAVAHALIAAGVQHLVVADLDLARAQALADNVRSEGTKVEGVPLAEAQQWIPQADGIVNATPVGMAAHPGTPFDTSILQPHQWVSDVIYMPLRTQLLEDAHRIGCPTLDGSGMAVGQAADAFALFSGKQADVERMRSVFRNHQK